MDPRDRADAVLSKARARSSFVVTPDNATSPMDAANTQQIPHSLVSEIDQHQDPDRTTVLPASLIAANDHHLADAQPTRPLPKPSGEPRASKQAPPQRAAPAVEVSQAETLETELPTASPAAEVSQTGTSKTGVSEAGSGELSGIAELDGLVPTITQHSGARSSLSRTLDGLD